MPPPLNRVYEAEYVAVTGLFRLKAYRFLDMLLCRIYLPQGEEYVSEIGIRILDSDAVVGVADKYIPISLYSPIVVTLLD